MTYTIVLYSHTWLRWVVLAFGATGLAMAWWSVAKGRSPRAEGTLRRAFVATLDLQFLLGLALYVFLSPYTLAAREDLRAAMKNSLLRFFAVEHLVGMVLALALVHVAAVRSRRAADPALGRRRWAIGLTIAVLIVLASIPWPFLPYGRPLFRW